MRWQLSLGTRRRKKSGTKLIAWRNKKRQKGDSDSGKKKIIVILSMEETLEIL
jgi:hypothetical protein